MISLTGFDSESFATLHLMFERVYSQYTPYSKDRRILLLNPLKGHGRGRHRLMSSKDCLALSLLHARTMGADFVLFAFFGITHTPGSLWLRFGRAVLVSLLRSHPKARVQMPTDEIVVEYKEAVAEKYPRLKEV